MAAISENYSGGTFLSDLVTRPEFLQYTSEGISSNPSGSKVASSSATPLWMPVPVVRVFASRSMIPSTQLRSKSSATPLGAPVALAT